MAFPLRLQPFQYRGIEPHANRHFWPEIAHPDHLRQLLLGQPGDVVAVEIGHLRWADALPPALEKTFGALPLLTDEVVQFLLPAFLFRALEDISPENKFLEWTLYTLCSAYEEDEPTTEATDAERLRRIAGFTREQREAVRAFLKLVSTAPRPDFHVQPISHALAAIWTV